MIYQKKKKKNLASILLNKQSNIIGLFVCALRKGVDGL